MNIPAKFTNHSCKIASRLMLPSTSSILLLSHRYQEKRNSNRNQLLLFVHPHWQDTGVTKLKSFVAKNICHLSIILVPPANDKGKTNYHPQILARKFTYLNEISYSDYFFVGWNLRKFSLELLCKEGWTLIDYISIKIKIMMLSIRDE